MTARRRLRHSVNGAEFDAAASAVDTYRRGGWVPVDELDEQPEAKPPVDKAASTSGESEPVTENEPPRGRRSKKED